MAIDTNESNEEKLERYGVFKSKPQKHKRKHDIRNVLDCVLFISIVVSLVFAMISAIAIDDSSNAGKNTSNNPTYVTLSDGKKYKVAGSEYWGSWNAHGSTNDGSVNIGTVTVLWILAIFIEIFLLCISQKKIFPNIEIKKLVMISGTVGSLIVVLLIYTIVKLLK